MVASPGRPSKVSDFIEMLLEKVKVIDNAHLLLFSIFIIDRKRCLLMACPATDDKTQHLVPQ